jgi:pimeloyl-ACP methyl ester carboxylesterase
VKGGWIEDLTFPSRYAPHREAARRMLARYPANSTAYARHHRHEGRGHPALIWLHGWGMGNYRIEALAIGLESIFRLGLDVYLYVHPYHGARLPPEVRFAGTLHPSTQVTRTNEAFLQTAWEVRALVARHQQELGGGPCGVAGWSLGGYAAAMLASLAPELDFAVPIVPITDVPALLWNWGGGTRERAAVEAAGITFEEFCVAMAVHAPLARELALPRERVLLVGARGDRIIPPEHTEVLHAHWGRPELHWFAGSHFVHFGRRKYFRRVRGFLERLYGPRGR